MSDFQTMWTVASYVYFQIYKIDKIYKKFQNWHNLALLTFLALYAEFTTEEIYGKSDSPMDT